MKKITVVSDTIPNLKHGGGGVTIYSAIMGFLEQGLVVDVIVINGGELENKEHIENIEKLGASVSFLGTNANNNLSFWQKVRREISPKFKDIFPNVKISCIMQKKISEINPDSIFAYHWGAISAIYGIEGYLKIAVVGDPIHLPSLFRKTIYSRLDHKISFKNKVVNQFSDLFINRLQVKGMVRLLNDSDISGAFASHHAKELEGYGVGRCNYFHTPVPEVNITHESGNEKFKIVLLGLLVGVATLSGIEIFVNEIYPKISKKIGVDNFEVHVVGGMFDTMPEELKSKLIKKNIVLRGQVTPADKEFLSADVLLVPTPIDLGIRVRIITAFSFGGLVIAHSANQKGIPELKHEYNGLIGNNGFEMAEQIIKVYNKEVNIEEIKANSRITYENFFTPMTFAQEIQEEIGRLS
jgi:glycosyltransferase involved in cell wall biosynthesis